MSKISLKNILKKTFEKNVVKKNAKKKNIKQKKSKVKKTIQKKTIQKKTIQKKTKKFIKPVSKKSLIAPLSGANFHSLNLFLSDKDLYLVA